MGKPATIARLLRRAKGEVSEAAGVAAEEDPAAGAGAPGSGTDGAGERDGTGEDLDLEAGIASIFESIRSGGGPAVGDLPEDNGATYDLLSRLNQLWQSPDHGAA